MGVFGVDQKERKQDLGSVGRAPTERDTNRDRQTHGAHAQGEPPQRDTNRHIQTHGVRG